MTPQDNARDAQRSRRVTSADVARACGVSRATVSYVMNDTPGKMISDATRELVLSTARELGHVPYAPARSLRLGHSNIVLALVRDFSPGYISNSLLRRLDVAFAERRYVMLSHRYDPTLRSITDLWQLVSPALVIAMGGLPATELDAIENTRTAVLRVHGTMPNVEVGAMQARYLVAKGHSRMGYVLPTESTLAVIAQERLEGFTAQCKESGVAAPRITTVDTQDAQSVSQGLEEMWDAGTITALATHNDDIALMVLARQASVAGEGRPTLAVIGVDDVPAAANGLTTVRIDVDLWASQVVQAAIALLDGHSAPPMSAEILSVVERTSA